MASLEFNHIYKVYQGGVKAVNDFTLKVYDKEFIVLVGPSGCGKSTTLRMIAGLEEITAGELRIGDKIVNDMQPKERNIAMVFQNYALYPHMSVYDNIAYGLRIQHVSHAEIDRKVKEAAEILGITEYLDRKPKALSGGQRQRVALGRAIVRNPKVFLLDEPLSNLDAKLRSSMRTEISKLHNRLQTTFIYVTHDQIEAMTMGTRIVVMKGGFIQQVDTPRNIFNYPVNKFVAGFIGTPQMNFYNCTMNKTHEKVAFSLENGNKFSVAYKLIDHIPTSYMNGVHKCILGIRPDNVAIYEEGMKEKDYAFTEAKVDIFENLGGETIIYGTLKTPEDIGTNKDSAVRIKTTKDIDVKIGDEIKLAIDLHKIHVFDLESEKTIMPLIPEFSEVKTNISDGKATIGDSSMIICPKLASQLVNGPAQIIIPSDAIAIGKGNILAQIINTTPVADNKVLYDLKVGDDLIFALSDPIEGTSESTMIDLDQSRISVMQGEKTIHAFDEQFLMPGSLIKDRKDKTYLISISGATCEISKEKCQKLFNAKGKKILKTPLDFQTKASDIDLKKHDLTGKIEDVYDYGDKVYAKVMLSDKTILWVKMDKPEIGKEISFGLNIDKTNIIDHKLNIILA